jgi:flagellar biosynthetic protein FliP
MSPTLDKLYADGLPAVCREQDRVRRGAEARRAAAAHVHDEADAQADVMLFAKLAKLDPAIKTADVPFKVLVPAFVTSELKSAFQIGFLVFLPFLIIDMIVASVLMSLGMMMLSPVLIALPFKLMLFVLADGWNLLLGSLAASFLP